MVTYFLQCGDARLIIVVIKLVHYPESYLYRPCTKIRLDERRAKKRPRRLSALARPSSCVALAGRFTSQTFRTKWDGNAHTA